MKAKRRLRRGEIDGRIARLAGRLERRDAPKGLWDRIASRLAAEEADPRPRPAESFVEGRAGAGRILRAFRLPDGRWSGARLSLACAGVALAALLAVPGFREPVVSKVARTAPASLAAAGRDAARAERDYGKAIDRLSRLAGQNEANIDPGLLALYREKLDLLDGSIRECRTAIDANGRNPAVHAALLYCYRQKVETLEQMAVAERS